MKKVISLILLTTGLLASGCITLAVSDRSPSATKSDDPYSNPRKMAIILTELVEMKKNNNREVQFDEKVNVLVADFISRLEKFYGPCPGKEIDPINFQIAKSTLIQFIDDMIKCSGGKIGQSVTIDKQAFECASKSVQNPLTGS